MPFRDCHPIEKQFYVSYSKSNNVLNTVLVLLSRTHTPNLSSLALLVCLWSSIEIYADSAGGGVGGSRGKEGPRGPGIDLPKGEMPVCAFIREPMTDCHKIWCEARAHQ